MLNDVEHISILIDLAAEIHLLFISLSAHGFDHLCNLTSRLGETKGHEHTNYDSFAIIVLILCVS